MIQIRTNQTLASLRKVFGIVSSFVLISPVLNAQGKAAVTPDSVDQFFSRESILTGKQKSNLQTIDLNIKDSSLSYILRRISIVSGKQIIFSTSLQQLSKHTSVRFKEMPVLDAVNAVLKGSGLTAAVSGDGNTIVVRGTASMRDTTENNGKGAIEGKVLDSASGKAVHGATISIPGSSASVISKADGSFRLSNLSDGNYQLMVKLLGYKSQQLSIKIANGQTQSLTVRISPSATSLNEVVTTATGQQRRVEIPSDIVKINAEEIRQRAPVRSLIDMIEAAQVPGVVVTRASGDPGAATRVRIRGIGSISQSNDPVYIVDGMWVDATAQSPSRIDLLDPEMVETVEVVRGPSAATLYGQDASNGVIVVTTKKGTAGTTRWNVGYSRDWGRAYGKIPFFYEGHGYNPTTGVRVLCPIDFVLDFSCVQDSVAVYDPNNRMVLREGQERRDNYSFSMDGGTNTVRYSLAARVSDVIGVRRAAPIDIIRMRRLSLRYGSDILNPSRMKDNSLTSNLSLTPRQNIDILLSLKAGIGDLIDNNYNFALAPTDNLLSVDTINFFTDGLERDFNQNRKTTSSNNTSFGSTVSWRTMYGLIVKTTGGIDQTSRNETASMTKNKCRFTECVDDYGTRNEGTSTNRVASLRTNVSTVLIRGSFSRFVEMTPVFGFDLRKTKRDNFSVLKDSVPGGETSIESGRLRNALGRRVEVADGGWYLSSTIGILRRLYFDVGIRQDIGSALTSSSNTTYPKLGGSWLVSDEGFWPQNSFVNLLRVRATVGHAAVQPDITDIRGSFVTGTKLVDGKLVKSLEIVKVGNSDLVPERAVELEVGFDVDMLNERLRIGSSYVHKENKNTLVVTRLPESLGKGVMTRKENIGRVQNRNVEMSLNAIAVDRDWLRVEAEYSHSISDNRVKSLGQGRSSFIRGTNMTDGAEIIAVGYPLAGVWKRPVIGYFDENLDGLLSDVEIIRNDYHSYVGSSTPRYVGNYGINAMMFGKITVDTRFTYNSRYLVDYRPYRGARSQGVDQGAQDVDATLELQAQSRALGVGNISNIRWNSVSLSYSVTPRQLPFLNARNITISLKGSNLGLWTKFIGRDPWVNNSIGTSNEILTVGQGFTPPPPRKFAFNVKMGI